MNAPWRISSQDESTCSDDAELDGSHSKNHISPFRPPSGFCLRTVIDDDAEVVRSRLESGATAVICSPPTNRELFSPMMERYRAEAGPRKAMGGRRPPSKASADEMRDLVREFRDNGLLAR